MSDRTTLRAGDLCLLNKASLVDLVEELLEAESLHVAEIERLRKWEEHGGLLRDVVESIGVGGAQMTPREAVLRGQCRLLAKAFDDGVL